MFKNPDFYYERGCFWWLCEIGGLIFAIFDVILDINSGIAWIILVLTAVDLALWIPLYFAGKRNYYKEDSFWLRKDEEEENQENS